MRAYIIRRLLLVVPTLLLVTLIVFLSVRFIPGDLVTIMAKEHEHMSGETEQALRRELGLDVPVYVQYGRWLGVLPNNENRFDGLLQGSLGFSLWSRRPVLEHITPRLPVSFELGLLALIIAQIIALPVGIYSAIRQDTAGDYIGRSVAIACIALPSFWLGTLVMVYPALWWKWAPPMVYIPFIENPAENLRMFIIPATILGMVMSGTTMRMTRTMMLEVLRQDYIRTAWSKGLKERVVVFRHALRNALIPVITIIAMLLPVLIGGSIVLEKIFNLPGIGRLLLFTVTDRDYNVLSGINLIIACFVLVINLSVDLTYAYLDPRVRYR